MAKLRKLGKRLVTVVVLLVVFLSVLSASLMTGGYKVVRLVVYQIQTKDKSSPEYKKLSGEFRGTLAENELSGFYAGYYAHRIWLWDTGSSPVIPG
jgi:hypothetical protein